MEKRVLVVDDEVAIVDGLTALLELEEIGVAGAFDCDGALALMEDAFYPAIVSDLRLNTEAEGLRLIDTIRELSPRSRVVVLSGYATPQVEAELRARGVSFVLHKPAASQEILDAIHALLEEMEREVAQEDADLAMVYSRMQSRLADIPRKRFGLSAEVAEDVVQEAWLLFLRKRGLIRAAEPWLAGTVANLSRQQIDRRVRKRETAHDEEVPEHVIASESSVTDAIALRQALSRSEERVQLLCSLIGLEGLSYEEVSAQTGIPLGSIGPLYIRAKRKLRAALEN
jgi:RNA polymerase sigma factor (sigma-70 family)